MSVLVWIIITVITIALCIASEGGAGQDFCLLPPDVMRALNDPRNEAVWDKVVLGRVKGTVRIYPDGLAEFVAAVGSSEVKGGE